VPSEKRGGKAQKDGAGTEKAEGKGGKKGGLKTFAELFVFSRGEGPDLRSERELIEM